VYPTTYINVHDSLVVLCPLLFLLLLFLLLLLLLSDSYSAFPDFFISSLRHPSPFVTSAISSWFLCLVFVRFPLDYSIDPRDSLIVLSCVSSLFNLLTYEFLMAFFLKIFIFRTKIYSFVFKMRFFIFFSNSYILCLIINRKKN